MGGRLPYKVGDTVCVAVESFGSDGAGRAMHEGHEVRVRYGIPGETADATVTHVGNHAIWARVDAATLPDSPSPDRVSAPCPVISSCGGCPWQHLSPSAQRRHRCEGLRAELAPVTAEATWHPWQPETAVAAGYRTRALMILRHVRGRLRAGFYQPRSQDIVPAEDCLAQDPRLQSLIPQIIEHLDAAQLPSWRGPKRPGLLRALALRVDQDAPDGDILVTLVVTAIDGRLTSVAHKLLEIPGIGGVFANINDRDGGPILGTKNVHVAGLRRQLYGFGSFALELGPTAFVQTQQAAGTALLEVVCSLLGEAQVRHAADLFAGVGVFGVALARTGIADRVTLVESNPAAVADAYQISGELLPDEDALAIIEADVADGVSQLAAMGEEGPQLVILDPPRAGLQQATVEALAAMAQVHTIVYVSCNVRTLARDLARWAPLGLIARDVVPVDMFPNTPHAETVVVLYRTGVELKP